MKKFKIIQYFENVFNAKTFLEGLRPISFISAISGIHIFTYDLKKCPKSHTNIPLVMYSLCWYSIFVYCTVKVLGHDDQVQFFKTSQLLKHTFIFKIILGMICASSLVIEGFICSNRYAVNLYNFVNIDKMMIELGIKIDYRILFKESLFVVVATQAINIAFEVAIRVVVSEQLIKSSWKLNVAVYGPGYFSEMNLLFYGMYAYQVKVNIDRINKQLAELCDVKLIRGMGYSCYKRAANEDTKSEIKKIKSNMAFTVKMSKLATRTILPETNKVMKNMARTKKINAILRVYDKICDMTDGLYEAYSFKVLIIIAFCFISLVLNLFYVLGVVTYIYYGDYSNVLISLFWTSLHQGIMNIVFVLFITTTCEQCILRVIIEISLL